MQHSVCARGVAFDQVWLTISAYFCPGAPTPLALIRAAIYTCDFDPHCDRERKYRKYPWVEMKDHIYLSSGLAAVTVAPGPAISTLGQVPSLTWASDHMSHVVDFRFR